MSDEADPQYTLNGISEDDFRRWKHQPVTKVLMRYLQDYEAQLAQRGIRILRNKKERPTEFELGVFQGEINEVARIAELSFVDLVEFYPPEEEEEADDA